MNSLESASTHTGTIIVGAPRSGTTLLRRLINAHPNIACPGETFLLRGGARFLQGEKIANGIDYGVRGGLRLSGFQHQDIYRRLREFVTSFHRDYAAERGKAKWAEKTAVDVFYLREIENFMAGHANFILLVRDGVDVIKSWADWTVANQKYIEEVYQYIKLFPAPNEAYAHAWADLTSSMLEFADRHPREALLIRYEDLVSDTNTVMQKVFNHMGEEFDPEIVSEALKDSQDIGMGDWKTYERFSIDKSSIDHSLDLPPEEISRLGKIMNEQLATCGYDVLTTVDELNEEQAERKYQLSLMYQAMQAAEKNDLEQTGD